MWKSLLIIAFLITGLQSIHSQDDPNYKEDQFYFGITYNLLGKKPNGLTQNGFSGGFHLGFIKDMPINTNRNLAIGLGLGYSTNSINQNLFISENAQGSPQYELVSSGSFSKNKVSMHLIELPLEIRWRTSTPVDYAFWRIYTGFKLGYVIASTSKHEGEPMDVKLSGLDDINRLQYGLTLSVGYDKINAHLYYSLSTLFDSSAKLNGDGLDINVVKIGLILYIL